MIKDKITPIFRNKNKTNLPDVYCFTFDELIMLSDIVENNKLTETGAQIAADNVLSPERFEDLLRISHKVREVKKQIDAQQLEINKVKNK